jgi:hypothetical protein
MNGLFGVNGLLGYLVAVVLLLSIVFVFGMNAVAVQKREATNYYKMENPFDLKMISTTNVNHMKNGN